MIFAIIFAQVWGVIQLIVLTSLARTVRVRTVLAAMAVGFYAIGPITAFLQLAWIRIAAHLFGKVVSDLTGVASYTVDPFIEEAMKLLPLLVLFLIPAIRRQWSVTDCLLIAAATGSGFGLAEHLFRYADYTSTAQSVSGGYLMTIGSATPFVPGIVRTLTSWIPLGVFFESNAVHVNWHLAWSAITGLAVGLFLRNPKKWARPTAVGLLVLVCLNHAAGNAASIQYTWLSPIAAPMHFLDSVLALLVLVAIVVAWWLDQPSQRAGMSLGPLLAAEQAAPSRLAGTLTAAFSRLPWSIIWVCGFDRARRAYHAARAGAPGSVDDMRDAITAERDSVDRRLSQQEAPPLLPPALMPNNLGTTVRSALRRPPVIIWLVLIAPSVVYLIIGGFPALSGLQAVMKGPIVWPVVLLITVFGRGRSVWRVLAGIRKLPAAVRHPMGDDAAMITLQAASGLGTLSLAGFTIARVLSGVGAGDRMLSAAHAADAINRTQPAGGAAIAGSAGSFDPPPPAAASSGNAATSAPSAGAGEGTGSSSGESTPGGGSSGDSPNSAHRPGHEMPVNETKGPPAPAPSDGDGQTPLDAQTVVSTAQPGSSGLSNLAGAFDPPPPSVQLPDEQQPSGYSPLPPPAPPGNDSPSGDTQSTESPSDYSSSAEAKPAAPGGENASGYSPLPPPAPPGNDSPSGDTQSTESPSDYSSTPSPAPPSAGRPDGTPDNEEGYGTRSPDDTPEAPSNEGPTKPYENAPGPNTLPPPPPPPPESDSTPSLDGGAPDGSKPAQPPDDAISIAPARRPDAGAPDAAEPAQPPDDAISIAPARRPDAGAPEGTPDNEEGYGTRSPDDESDAPPRPLENAPSPNTLPPPPPPPPSSGAPDGTPDDEPPIGPPAPPSPDLPGYAPDAPPYAPPAAPSPDLPIDPPIGPPAPPSADRPGYAPDAPPYAPPSADLPNDPPIGPPRPPSATLPDGTPDNEHGVGTRSPDTPDDDPSAAAGKAPAGPAVTIAPANQAEIDAATGKIPAPTMTSIGSQNAPAAGGGTDPGEPGADPNGTSAPDNPAPSRPAAPTQAQMDQLARSEQADDNTVAAQKEIGRSEQADDDAVAAQKAVEDPGKAADHIPSASAPDIVADAQARAAHRQAVAAEAAKAATDPLGAAADAAQRDLAAAQQRENDAFFNKDAKGYHDARAALEAAKQKAAAAQAAADAASKDGSGTITSHKKP